MSPTALIADATALKNAGNAAYLADNFEEAHTCFQKAVLTLLRAMPPFDADLMDVDTEANSTAHVGKWEWRHTFVGPHCSEDCEALQLLAVLFCNMALLSQRQDRPLLSLYYNRLSLQCNPNYAKAKVRKAQSLVELRRLHEADVYIQACLREMKEDPAAQSLVEELKQMQKSIPQLVKLFSSVPKVLEILNGEATSEAWDMARTYVGPMELFQDAEKGRGFRAWRRIRAGEVLLLEKGYVAPEEDFTGGLLDMLDKREDLRAHFWNLFPTKDVPLGTFFVPEVRDSFSAAMNNQFQTFKRLNSARRWKHLGMADAEELVWKKYLNACDVLGEGVGLFPWMAHLNHSCDPNALRLMAHGMVLMFARRDIEAGEEITHNYVPLHEPYALRQLHLLETHGFRCACERCASAAAATTTTSEEKPWGARRVTESELTGMLCPNCHTLTTCRNTAASDVYGEYKEDDLAFTCSGCDWHLSVHEYEEMYENIIDWCGDLHSTAGAEHDALVKNLKRVEVMLPRASRLRLALYAGYAKYHAISGRDAEAKQYVQKVEDTLKLYADPRLTVVAANMLMVVAAKLQRNLAKKELEMVAMFGWDMALLRRMWDIEEPYRLQRYFYSIG